MFLLQDWQAAAAKLTDTEARMVAVLDELQLTGLVTSITGLSRVGAAAILAGTGDPRRFATARALVKHAGLAPREKLSGTFVGRTKLTGQGRPRLRLAAWRAVWEAQRANPVYGARYQHLTGAREQQAHPHPGADRDRCGDPASPARRRHHRSSLGPRRRHPRHPATSGARRRLTNEPAAQAGGRGEPSAALRHTVISTQIMGSPARRLTNPITRCWDQPHHRDAGTDDGRGTDQKLDPERLTLIAGAFTCGAPRRAAGRTRMST